MNSKYKLMGGLAAVAITAVALPSLITVPYFMHLVILALIWVILAQGQNLIQGFVGYVSIAQAGFMGIGAYFSTLLTVKLGWPVWTCLALAPLFTALVSVVVGYPSLRVKGHYFAIVTLAYNMVIFTILMTFSSLTGGEAGIPDVPRPSEINVGGWVINFEGRSSVYYYGLVALVAALVTGLCALILHSRVGRVLVAIRQNETLADSMGVSTWRYKLLAFVVSAGMAGLAGALYAHYIGFLNPEPFGVDQSLNAILAVILGGSGTLTGPIIGAFAVVFLPEYLRIADSYRLVTYGLILVLTTIFLPRGVVPVIQQAWLRAKALLGR
ncbi:MAG: branched-chain amino acid ABC transporter permease [Ideonella sp. MAG2]|nr:MAG: branched-chain amino acid ABC transporter permease [Ideonella sp. MAG2]